MNQLIFSFLAAVTVIFHIAARPFIKRGKVWEAFCASWCIDAVFAVCGTAISFGLYQYDFTPLLTLRSLLWGLLFLTVILLLFLLAPSGLSLFVRQAKFLPDDEILDENKGKQASRGVRSLKKNNPDQKEILPAEYRFNDTLCMVRNFFLALLFTLPVILTVFEKSKLQLSLFLPWSETEICGAFCFTAFLILLPISLRQAFFWLKHLQEVSTEEENRVLVHYGIQLHYKQRNRRL